MGLVDLGCGKGWVAWLADFSQSAREMGHPARVRKAMEDLYYAQYK
jgi:hypothetical protein